MREVLVFDLDDTLYPEHRFAESGFAAVDRWLVETRGLAGFGARATAAFRAGRRGRIFDETLAELGWDAHGVAVDDLLAVYRSHEPSISLHDDAAWAIAALGPTHRLGMITDGYLETQRRKVAALRIAPAFEAIVYSDELGRAHWKPDPKPYETLMARLGCDGSACTYVSDNPAKDFVAANALGWDTIHIVRPDGEYREVAITAGMAANRRIASLCELGDLLGATSVPTNSENVPTPVGAIDEVGSGGPNRGRPTTARYG